MENWTDRFNGKVRQRRFNISIHGEQMAYNLACQYRDEMTDKMNANGAGYSERHGTTEGVKYEA